MRIFAAQETQPERLLMEKKQKFYVVWQGRQTGIFNTWEECKKQVTGFATARYKSFENESEARQAFAAGSPRYQPQKSAGSTAAAAGKPIMVSISVDAACSGNPGIMEYQGVETSTKKRLFHGGPFPEGTNNIGEFLAIVHGLSYLKRNNLNIPLYTDSKTAIAWVRNKKANTKIKPTAGNAALLELIARAEYWLKINSWNNPILKWETTVWGEIPADFGRK